MWVSSNGKPTELFLCVSYRLAVEKILMDTRQFPYVFIQGFSDGWCDGIPMDISDGDFWRVSEYLSKNVSDGYWTDFWWFKILGI